ncbi:MAG: DUF4038 domain-containing protein [Candidatus Bathyarchaeia archaeon]
MVSELKHCRQNCVFECSFASRKEYADPFNEVELSAVVTDPEGEEKVVPAFWAGGNFWRIRYASHKVGRHHFRTICSDNSNPDLHDQEGILEVIPYKGDNRLFKHGPLRVSQDRKYMEHIDGTPFFWLGDTWWMGLTKRLAWPEGFKTLTADRVEKGFTVIQIVAGLYPDMPPFDPRGANEAGFPWEENYVRINPAYFDMADRRIDWLVQNGLVPCIVGSWGYFIEFTGEETMKKHWRNLVARYGAYPVVWCVAGEATMPNYLSPAWHDREKREEYQAEACAGWTRVARYLRSIDPYHHPITIHPSYPDCGRNMVDDPSVIDMDMLQTGHWDMQSLPTTVNMVVDSIARSPRMPVLVGEVCYEGILGASWENVQRLMFWASTLNGAAGYTYGANGIWQVNTEEEPYGPSPHQQSWGEMPWNEACQLLGSRQVGLGKRLLERYSWWRFEQHLEWVEPHWSKDDYLQPYAAGIPKQVRVFYIQGLNSIGILGALPKIKKIERGITYHAFYFDPRNGKEYDVGTVVPDGQGEWQPPSPPIIQDWVLVMEAKG